MRFLKYRTAVITGAGSGIGRALAMEMAELGMNLALVDRDEATLLETKQRLSARARIVSIHCVDLLDDATLTDLPRAVLSHHRTIDVLVNNAGVTCIKSVIDHTMADFDWVMGVNFRALVMCTKLFAPFLLKRPEAHIVNVSSLFGFVGVPSQSAYCASKYAVRGFSESIQEEFEGTPISVTLVHPGGVATNVIKKARVSDAKLQQQMSRAFESGAMSPRQVAVKIVRAIQRKQRRLLVSKESVIADWLRRLLPVWGNRLMVKLLIRAMGLGAALREHRMRFYALNDNDDPPAE